MNIQIVYGEVFPSALLPVDYTDHSNDFGSKVSERLGRCPDLTAGGHHTLNEDELTAYNLSTFGEPVCPVFFRDLSYEGGGKNCPLMFEAAKTRRASRLRSDISTGPPSTVGLIGLT